MAVQITPRVPTQMIQSPVCGRLMPTLKASLTFAESATGTVRATKSVVPSWQAVATDGGPSNGRHFGSCLRSILADGHSVGAITPTIVRGVGVFAATNSVVLRGDGGRAFHLDQSTSINSRAPMASRIGQVARRSDLYGPILSTGMGLKPKANAGESDFSR